MGDKVRYKFMFREDIIEACKRFAEDDTELVCAYTIAICGVRMNKLEKAFKNNSDTNLVLEVKDAPTWMAPYDKMLLMWCLSETHPDLLWHVLPYRSDTDQFHYEVVQERKRR